MQSDLVACVFRNEHAVMHCVCGARRDQAHVNDGARSPGVALVDRVPMGIDLQRAVKVRTFFNRTFAAILNHAAPEDGLAFIVRAFQFQPRIVGIDGASGEKVSDCFGAHHDIHAHGIAAAQCWPHQVQAER